MFQVTQENWALINHVHELLHMAAATLFFTTGFSALYEYRILRSRFVLSYSAMCLFSAGYALYVVISHNLSPLGEFWIPWTDFGLVVTFFATFLYLRTVGQFLDVQSRLFSVPLALLGIITVAALGDLLLYAAARRSFLFIPVPREGIEPHQLSLGEGAYSLLSMAEILPVVFIASFTWGVVYLLIHLFRNRSNQLLIYIGLFLTGAIIVNENLVAMSVYGGVYLLAFTKVFEALRIHRDIRMRSNAQLKRHLHEVEKRKLEKLVHERTLELKTANKELEAFSYSVSHDLRAPLRHIVGFVDLLQRKRASSADEKSRHYMAAVSDSAKNMGQLIDDLLSFSRLGRQAMTFKQIDLKEIVRSVVEELSLDTGGTEVHWHIGELPTVRGDASLLRIVLTNLLSNAVKFSGTREQARIEVGCQFNGNENTLFVRDNGVGFDPAYADKLFGVFQRLHHADEFEGTGAGLAIAQRIIHRHGGRIWAESEPGKGATFYFSLPLENEGGQ